MVNKKRYQGKVQALVLDWSGTTADAYVAAPAVVFVEVFKRQNVEISIAETCGASTETSANTFVQSEQSLTVPCV